MGKTIEGELSKDNFGRSVATSKDGTLFIAGGPSNDVNGRYSGHARVFRYNAYKNSWEQVM